MVHLPPGGTAEVALRCSCGTSHRASVTAPFYVAASPGLDPFFGLPLWLQTNVRGNLLWAWSEAHLEEIERFVEALLRERSPQAGNSSMASRLPAWMKRANAREPMRKGLQKLRAQLRSKTPRS
ncbi:MAG: TFIIB-type zinc ribbon-containing protein [Deltaproteobacteria bacterium]|nr:TFIIB-type zinc ribbon-containing protein [Deltaproteobacteria bacterium]